MTTITAPPPAGTRTCPKCGQAAAAVDIECRRCGVIIDKAIQAQTDASAVDEATSPDWPAKLEAAEGLSIKQSVEMLEAWTGIESANSYVVKDGMNNVVFHAVEESGGVGDFLVRNYLQSARPFTMRVQELHGDTAFVIQRPFRFLFSEIEIQDPLGRRMGSVERQFSVFNSLYTVTGRRPTEKYEIFGPLFRPWTFKIRQRGQDCGLITKRWGGLRRETFTDADAFGIEFPPGISHDLKAVFLGAVFLIDFAHFEHGN